MPSQSNECLAYILDTLAWLKNLNLVRYFQRLAQSKEVMDLSAENDAAINAFDLETPLIGYVCLIWARENVCLTKNSGIHIRSDFEAGPGAGQPAMHSAQAELDAIARSAVVAALHDTWDIVEESNFMDAHILHRESRMENGACGACFPLLLVARSCLYRRAAVPLAVILRAAIAMLCNSAHGAVFTTPIDLSQWPSYPQGAFLCALET